MNEEFAHIVDTHSAITDAIVEELMFHSHKEDAKRFLRFVDNYICYYLHREHDEIQFPILVIPSCPSWAREVFLKYLILRLAIYYNADTIGPLLQSRVSNLSYVDPFDSQKAREARKKNKYLNGLGNYKLKLRKFKTVPSYLGEAGHKNLLFCTPQDIAVSRDDKNEFISEFYGEVDDIYSNKNLCVCHNLTTKDIRQKIMHKKEELAIDNIFVLYTNNEECNSLSKTNLDRLNRICKTSIRNCFVFDFSDYPYCLNRSLHRHKRFSYTYLGLDEKTNQNNSFFTALDDEESRYAFLEDEEIVGSSDHIHSKADPESHEVLFNGLIGTYTDNAEFWLQERNFFSLCMSDLIIERYKERIRHFVSTDEFGLFDESFAYQKEMAKWTVSKILSSLRAKERGSVAIVVDFYFPNSFRPLIKALFPGIQVKLYNYSALKPIRTGKGRVLGNSLKEKDVFVLRYRPHNARTPFAKYPNSFDPFVTNPGQHVTEIIQDFVFIDKYLWDQYDYELEEYKYFNSVFRKEVLGGLPKPIKPNLSRVSGNEEPDEEGINTRQTIASIDILYDSGHSVRMPETEWVIYKIKDGETDIARLKELKEVDLLYQVTEMQRLDEIMTVLADAIIKREKEASHIERIIRQSYYDQGIITEEERDSGVYLWKLLLLKKTIGRPVKDLYTDFMSELKESERVQYAAFEKWVDKTNQMILPLQKSTQRKLFEYLGLSQNYLMVMRSRKITEVNRTRNNNNMLVSFLAEYLLSDINEDSFDQFKESKINEVLRYETIDDLKTLIEILNEYILLKKVERINCL